MPRLPVLSCPVSLPRRHLLAMARTVRLLYRLSTLPGYRHALDLPAVARHDPGHDALFMGYDFHLTNDGPRLIEVNTNAGGGWLALLAQSPGHSPPPAALERLFFAPFRREIGSFLSIPPRLPRSVVVVDEDPESQFLYPEVEVYTEWLRARGVTVAILPPEALEADARGVFAQGTAWEMVYNRHCDFYLETPAMNGLRQAYLSRGVCLSPNPRAYGLLADKRRLLLFCDPARLESLGLTAGEAAFLGQVVPQTLLLAEADPVRVWTERKHWVFKPVTSFGSRGVILGDGLSRPRFESFPPADTLMQRRIPPSRVTCGERSMKVDFRLFVYRDRTLGVGARVYSGQVTSLRQEDSGYAPVRITAGCE